MNSPLQADRPLSCIGVVSHRNTGKETVVICPVNNNDTFEGKDESGPPTVQRVRE